jgi:rSAM/selenodomain-associated transferase 1
MFAKYWQPGSVKTRLAARIGEQRAADVYRAFVFTLLRRFSDVAESRDLVFTPDHQLKEFQSIGTSAWQLHPQGPGDLGARMQRYFQRTLETGATDVVLIGSDSPTLPRRYLDRAFQSLQRANVVLGPSEDGGYYLIGARNVVPPIFAGIDWSTPRVWDQTLEKLNATELTLAVMPTWYDVDSAADLRRLQDELATGAELESGFRDLHFHQELATALGSDQ